MHAARIILGITFGLLSVFIVGYSVIRHNDLSVDEMFGFAYLAFFSGVAAGLFIGLSA
jgi:hypothetical protein